LRSKLDNQSGKILETDCVKMRKFWSAAVLWAAMQRIRRRAPMFAHVQRVGTKIIEQRIWGIFERYHEITL